MHPHPLSAREGLSLQPNFQKGVGGLTGTPFLEGGCWERGGGGGGGGGGGMTFFREVAIFQQQIN